MQNYFPKKANSYHCVLLNGLGHQIVVFSRLWHFLTYLKLILEYYKNQTFSIMFQNLITFFKNLTGLFTIFLLFFHKNIHFETSLKHIYFIILKTSSILFLLFFLWNTIWIIFKDIAFFTYFSLKIMNMNYFRKIYVFIILKHIFFHFIEISNRETILFIVFNNKRRLLLFLKYFLS